MTGRKMFGINLSNLTKQEEVADWTCLSPPNFDFSLDLPAPDMCPFAFDSKIYMAAGAVADESVHYYEDLPPNPVYEFKFDDYDDIEDGKKKKTQQQEPDETQQKQAAGFSPAESFPDAPVPFLDSYIANISGDVYFFADPRDQMDEPLSLYVLGSCCSESKDWKQLPLPPPFEEGKCDQMGEMFVLHDKLFLASRLMFEPYLAWFDPISQTWTEEQNRDNNVFIFKESTVNPVNPGRLYFTSLPHISVSLPGLSNYSVALSHSYVESEEPKFRFKSLACIKVSALLVNRQNGVEYYQHLDDCFKGIQPTTRCFRQHRFNLVDLGNGKLCALLYGLARELDNDSPAVLCISVFSLSVAKDFAPLHTDMDTDPPPSPTEQSFLSVTVHSKSVYTLKDWSPDEHLRHAFVWPPTKEGRFQHRTTSY